MMGDLQMKSKKIVVGLLAIVALGGIAGGISYKTHLKDTEKPELETQNIKKIDIEKEQAKKGQEEKMSKDSKKEVAHSNFKSKVDGYVTEFRESKDDIQTFYQNLNSINAKELNTKDKEHLDNLYLGADDWSRLTSDYNEVRQTGADTNPNPDVKEIMKYAKDGLTNVNIDNLIATGVMSKDTVDKYISVLEEYVKNKQGDLEKQEKLNKQMELESQKETDKQKELDKEHEKLKTTQEKEVFYYNAINEARKKQIEYINSIKDPKIKQSVQTSSGAATGEATLLELKYPEDAKIISESLAKVNKVS